METNKQKLVEEIKSEFEQLKNENEKLKKDKDRYYQMYNDKLMEAVKYRNAFKALVEEIKK